MRLQGRPLSAVDRSIGHRRRYCARSLTEVVRASGLEKDQVVFGNPGAIAGWMLNGMVLRRPTLPSGPVTHYARMKPWIRMLERPVERFTGLNLVLVARKAGSIR